MEMEKAVVEGAGATGLAAVLSGQLPELKGKRYEKLKKCEIYIFYPKANFFSLIKHNIKEKNEKIQNMKRQEREKKKKVSL